MVCLASSFGSSWLHGEIEDKLAIADAAAMITVLWGCVLVGFVEFCLSGSGAVTAAVSLDSSDKYFWN